MVRTDGVVALRRGSPPSVSLPFSEGEGKSGRGWALAPHGVGASVAIRAYYTFKAEAFGVLR